METENRLGKAIVEALTFYGCKIWLLKREEQRKFLVLEIDYLTSARLCRLQRIPNTTIRSKIQTEQSILGRI